MVARQVSFDCTGQPEHTGRRRRFDRNDGGARVADRLRRSALGGLWMRSSRFNSPAVERPGRPKLMRY
jgi:hypothetical protein